MSATVSVRRLLSVAAVSAFAVAVMLGAASSAQAATTETCVFIGSMGPINPGPQGIFEDLFDANLTDTDSGTYSFSTPANGATCVGEVNGAPFAGNGVITSNGQYTNSVCGTGMLFHSGPSTGNSTGSTTGTSVGPAPNITAANYDLNITAGEGPLFFNSAALNNGDTVHSAPESGWVSMQPTQPAPPGVPCGGFIGQRSCLICAGRATAFDVEGFFTVTNRL